MPSPSLLNGDRPQAQHPRVHVARPLIAVAAESRYLVQRQPAGLCVALARAGYVPLILDPEEPASAPLEVIDLIVARGRSAPLLSLLARAEGMGVRTINRCSAIAAVRDRGAMARALTAGDLPTPATSCGSIASIAAAFRPNEYPLIVKLVFGDNARAIRIVRSRAELLDLAWTEPHAVAQRLVPSDGFDLKLAVIGGEVFAARKPSSVTGDPAAKMQPVAVTPALKALALRCGLLFGLELFGVDCVEMAAGPMVIGVNAFPDYSGIPGADDCLASYAIDRACAHFQRRRA
jgi:ribosomal protein S6--L-glutamate ligase